MANLYQLKDESLHTQHYMMLQRNLLYTAVTRGKKLVILVGTKKALGMAVRRQDTARYANCPPFNSQCELSRDREAKSKHLHRQFFQSPPSASLIAGVARLE